jgi:hypothetical protein
MDLINSNIKEVKFYHEGIGWDSPENYYDDEINQPPMKVGIKLTVCILLAF